MWKLIFTKFLLKNLILCVHCKTLFLVFFVRLNLLLAEAAPPRRNVVHDDTDTKAQDFNPLAYVQPFFAPGGLFNIASPTSTVSADVSNTNINSGVFETKKVSNSAIFFDAAPAYYADPFVAFNYKNQQSLNHFQPSELQQSWQQQWFPQSQNQNNVQAWYQNNDGSRRIYPETFFLQDSPVSTTIASEASAFITEMPRFPTNSNSNFGGKNPVYSGVQTGPVSGTSTASGSIKPTLPVVTDLGLYGYKAELNINLDKVFSQLGKFLGELTASTASPSAVSSTTMSSIVSRNNDPNNSFRSFGGGKSQETLSKNAGDSSVDVGKFTFHDSFQQALPIPNIPNNIPSTVNGTSRTIEVDLGKKLEAVGTFGKFVYELLQEKGGLQELMNFINDPTAREDLFSEMFAPDSTNQGQNHSSSPETVKNNDRKLPRQRTKEQRAQTALGEQW